MNKNVKNSKGAVLAQPLLVMGEGVITFGKNISIGYLSSPFYYTTYCYLEARSANASIKIGNNVFINNNFYAIADKSSIEIKDNTIIGLNCSIVDSDFHSLDPLNRMNGSYSGKDVVIQENVFIGSNVTILKGVTIGENSVVANGALVNKDIPAGVVAAGVPAKVIRTL